MRDLLPALIPVAVMVVAFVAYCLYDLSRSEVRYLPKWVWAVVCLLSIPVGGLVYLLIGRRGDGGNHRALSDVDTLGLGNAAGGSWPG